MNRRTKDEVYSVTSAPENPSADRDERSRRYIIAMSVRVLCFLGIWVVHGWLRGVMVVLMIVLPYVAVIIANAGRESARKTPPPVLQPDLDAIEGRPDYLGPATS
jgi:Flp pilus assembly protein TadB